MTLSRTEFMRLLPAALGQECFELSQPAGAMVLTHRGGGRQWQIRLTGLPPLRLGSIAMERLQVELRFEGYPEEAVDAFVDRFLRGYQRGGG
jgi:hypothetical protein